MNKWKSFGGSIDNFKAHSKEVYTKEMVEDYANKKIIEELEKLEKNAGSGSDEMKKIAINLIEIATELLSYTDVSLQDVIEELKLGKDENDT